MFPAITSLELYMSFVINVNRFDSKKSIWGPHNNYIFKKRIQFDGGGRGVEATAPGEKPNQSKITTTAK